MTPGNDPKYGLLHTAQRVQVGLRVSQCKDPFGATLGTEQVGAPAVTWSC